MILIQSATNIINDYFDFKSGADSKKSESEKALVEDEKKKIDEKLNFIASKKEVYNQYWKAYLNEVTEFKKAQSEAQSATGNDPLSRERAVYWINMGPILKENVDRAERELQSEGFKDQITRAQAY